MTGLDVKPQAGWIRPRVDDDRDEVLTRHQQYALAQRAKRRELQNVLGALVLNTTMVQMVDGGLIGPARYEGRVLSWSIWAPHRRALIDVFHVMPPTAELDARQQFADDHRLRYAMVEPGKQLTAQSVKEWIDE